PFRMALVIPPGAAGPAPRVGGPTEVRVASYRNRLDLASAHVDHVEEEAREEVRGEQARRETDEQRDGEALHRAGPEVVEDRGRHHDGQVRVDDGAQRAREAGVDRRAWRLPHPQLFA